MQYNQGKTKHDISTSQVFPIEVGMYYCLDTMCLWELIGNTVSHIEERGISPETAAEKGYQAKREPEKKPKWSWLVYPDKPKSEMTSEGENTRKGKIAI